MDPKPDGLLAALALLGERGGVGLAWLDDRLVVTAKFGTLADFIAVGRHVGETLLPLYGLDDQITALAGGEVGMIEVPAVSMRLPHAPRIRLNIAVQWSPVQRCFLVLLTRAAAGSDVEVHLAQQMRARLMAEADATALARQLSRANRDLEEFASIISHDLKAPMRAMRYLTEDAATALADGRHELAAEKIARIREQSQRLSSMLAALFDYACAGTKQDIVERVDLRALVETIVRSLPQSTGLRIDLGGTWPVVDTLSAPFDLVVRNLIDNAIKHHDRGDRHIHVCATPCQDYLEIAVRDDGPGIPPRYHDAVFQPFRRLTANHDPASSGMGLALVKRIVECVGGRIELVSDPERGRGATFRILWPLYVAP